MTSLNASEPVIRTTVLTKRYGEFTAVREIDLDVGRAEIFAFLGPNGAGKTTTVRMLMGVLRPSAGTACIDGLDCFSASRCARSSAARARCWSGYRWPMPRKSTQSTIRRA